METCQDRLAFDQIHYVSEDVVRPKTNLTEQPIVPTDDSWDEVSI